MEQKFKSEYVAWASVFAFTAVALGAFAAHALREVMNESALQAFETAVRYQFFHALAIFLLALLTGHLGERRVRYVFVLFACGIFLFSGSIYVLSLKELHGLKLDWLGPVTPIGGLCLLLGWALLAFTAWRRNRQIVEMSVQKK